MRRIQSQLPRVLHDQHAFRPKNKRVQRSEHWLRPSCVTVPRIIEIVPKATSFWSESIRLGGTRK
jgi:hypothetical protein